MNDNGPVNGKHGSMYSANPNNKIENLAFNMYYREVAALHLSWHNTRGESFSWKNGCQYEWMKEKGDQYTIISVPSNGI